MSSPHQNRPPVYIEDLAGNEAGMVRTQEEDRRGDLFWAGDTAQRDLFQHTTAHLGLFECRRRHFGIDPSRRYAVHIDAVTRQFRREPLHHADYRALGGGIIAMVGLAALPGG